MKQIFLGLFVVLILTEVQSQETDERGFKRVELSSNDEHQILYEESHALVIGNSEYINGWPSLTGVDEDILEVAKTLSAQGFNVVMGENFTKPQMDSAYSDFIARYGNDFNNRLLFYFAGHGHTVQTSYGDKLGYLVPVDAPNPQENENRFQSTSMEMAQVEIYAKRLQSKHALFVFDACFSGSIFSPTRSISEAISYKTTQPVRQFITSGDENELVPDKSIFREQFTEALSSSIADDNQDGYLTGTELGEFLQSSVVNKSKSKQHPQYGKIRNPALDKGDFVFVVNPNLFVSNNRLKPSLGTIAFLETKGTIALNSDISGKVFLDEQEVGDVGPESSLFLDRVEAGKHNIRIEGAQNWWGIVEVKAGKTEPLIVSGYMNLSEGFAFMHMVSVEGGEFSMGNSEGIPDQQPTHIVRLKDFEIGAYEVTVRQFGSFIKETGYITDAEKGAGKNLINDNGILRKKAGLNWRYQPNGKLAKDLSQPVVFVTWNDAVAFTNWMTKKYPGEFRLPTEAEWEYTAQGGARRKITRYAGSQQLEEVSRYRTDKPFYMTRKKPNELSIFDMSGSVSEWCLDWYDKNYYRQSPRKMPKGPPSGDFKVLRGGSWLSDELFAQVAYRSKTNPNHFNFSDGFRVVRLPK